MTRGLALIVLGLTCMTIGCWLRSSRTSCPSPLDVTIVDDGGARVHVTSTVTCP